MTDDIVHRIGITRSEIVAIDIVDVAIVVIVDIVAGDLTRVDPHIGSQIGMQMIHTTVDHRHHHVGTGLDVPRLSRIDIRILRAATLPRIVQAPQTGEVRIIGRRRKVQFHIGLDVDHLVQLADLSQPGLEVFAFGQFHVQQRHALEGMRHLETGLQNHILDRLNIRSGHHTNQIFAFDDIVLRHLPAEGHLFVVGGGTLHIAFHHPHHVGLTAGDIGQADIIDLAFESVEDGHAAVIQRTATNGHLTSQRNTFAGTSERGRDPISAHADHHAIHIEGKHGVAGRVGGGDMGPRARLNHEPTIRVVDNHRTTAVLRQQMLIGHASCQAMITHVGTHHTRIVLDTHLVVDAAIAERPCQNHAAITARFHADPGAQCPLAHGVPSLRRYQHPAAAIKFQTTRNNRILRAQRI